MRFDDLIARVLAPWTRHPYRLDRLERFMSASSDAFAELDAQLDALESYVNNDDATDATEVSNRAARIKALLASVNPESPAPAPGEPGAPTPVDPGDVSPDTPVVDPNA